MSNPGLRSAPVRNLLELARGKPQLTRLQVDVFELTCPNDQLARLDLDRIADKDPACTQILERLRELGSARLLARLDDVMDLASKSNVTVAKRAPSVRDVTVSSGGKVTPSMTYEQVGFIGEFRGEWSEPEPEGLDLVVSLGFSNVAKSPVQVAEKVTLPLFVEVKIGKQIHLRNKVAAFTMGSDLPDPFDDKGQVTVTMVRLRATRLGA